MTVDENTETSHSEEPQTDQRTQSSQAAQRHYDPDRDGELTTAIVFALAEAEDISPTELKSPPLYEVIDVPAIEKAFFGPETRSGSRQGAGTVEFQYTDYLVTVKSDGWVQIYETNGTDLG